MNHLQPVMQDLWRQREKVSQIRANLVAYWVSCVQSKNPWVLLQKLFMHYATENPWIKRMKALG